MVVAETDCYAFFYHLLAYGLSCDQLSMDLFFFFFNLTKLLRTVHVSRKQLGLLFVCTKTSIQGKGIIQRSLSIVDMSCIGG